MPIVPDDKNWTWVLERPCPECRFDTTTVTRDDVGPVLSDLVGAWEAVLAGRDRTALRTRSSDERWSDLEYACHVRDVFRLFRVRLDLMLTEDDPTFANWDQDATAVEDRYGEQDPDVVRDELVTAGRQLAGDFARLGAEQWDRAGTRSDGARFDVERFSRYLLHDPVHHLHDVGADYPPAVARHA